MVDVGRRDVFCTIPTYVEWKRWVLRMRAAGENQERARTYLTVKLLTPKAKSTARAALPLEMRTDEKSVEAWNRGLCPLRTPMLLLRTTHQSKCCWQWKKTWRDGGRSIGPCASVTALLEKYTNWKDKGEKWVLWWAEKLCSGVWRAWFNDIGRVGANDSRLTIQLSAILWQKNE